MPRIIERYTDFCRLVKFGDLTECEKIGYDAHAFSVGLTDSTHSGCAKYLRAVGEVGLHAFFIKYQTLVARLADGFFFVIGMALNTFARK